MCRSQSEGGQRCAGHTRGPYEAAKFGTEEWHKAAANFASTPTGQKELEKVWSAARSEAMSLHFRSMRGLSSEEDLFAYNRAVDKINALESVIDQGKRIQEANKEAAAVIRKRRAAQQSPHRVPVPTHEHVRTVASALHASWQREFFAANGAAATRQKDDGDGGTVDIAHTDYADLPEKWQTEKRLSAESALARVAAATGDHSGAAALEKAAAGIHADWLSRNGEWAPAPQAVPYEQLSEAEKEKDRVVARDAATVLGVTL